MENKKHAIVLGATGLVGSALVNQLISHNSFHRITLITRRKTGFTDSKISELIIDFDHPELWQDKIKGDVLFSAFGTTLKKAGSKDVQYKIDFTYQVEVAKAAANNDVKDYVLVSSAGANSKSKLFYSRIKGELDDNVKQLAFEKIHLIKPSVLAGSRTEKRLGEGIGIIVGTVICKLPFLRKYRPIMDSTVAKAMINCSLNPKLGSFSHELNAVHQLAK